MRSRKWKISWMTEEVASSYKIQCRENNCGIDFAFLGDADIEDADSVANNEESVSGSGSGSRRSSESTNKSYGTASVRSSKSYKSTRSPNTQVEMSFVASEADVVAESSSPQHGDDDFGELEQEQVSPDNLTCRFLLSFNVTSFPPRTDECIS